MIRTVLLAGLLTLGKIQQEGKERGAVIIDHHDQDGNVSTLYLLSIYTRFLSAGYSQ